MIAIHERDQFKEATRTKLVLEIAGRTLTFRGPDVLSFLSLHGVPKVASDDHHRKAEIHYRARRRGTRLAARRGCAAGGDAGSRVSQRHIAGPVTRPPGRIPSRSE